jgi:hypothetical protein
VPHQSGDAQKRAYDEQDREWHIFNRAPAPMLNWAYNEVREEHEGDVFQSGGAQNLCVRDLALPRLMNLSYAQISTFPSQVDEPWN